MKNRCYVLLILLAISLQAFGQTSEGATAKGPEGVWLSDANSPLGSDGLPYVLPAFEIQGKGWGWKAAEAKATTDKRQMEIPLENEVVRFPATP